MVSIRFEANALNKGDVECDSLQEDPKLIFKREIQMENGKIIIEPVVSEMIIGDNVEDDPLLQDLEKESPNHILNASNNQCLFEIFNLFDTLSMLCSIANICVRFSEIAKQDFAKKKA